MNDASQENASKLKSRSPLLTSQFWSGPWEFNGVVTESGRTFPIAASLHCPFTVPDYRAKLRSLGCLTR